MSEPSESPRHAPSVGQTLPGTGPSAAPFLVWPIGRRQFYNTVSIALLPATIWAILIYGLHAWAILIATLSGAIVTHRVLQRFTERGRTLLLAQTISSALLLACLVHPMTSPWVMLGAGAALVMILWLLKGPGRDRVHPAVLIGLIIPLLIVPLLHTERWHFRSPAAVLASDRLALGDLAAATAPATLDHWPTAGELSGYDAALVPNVPDLLHGELLRVQHAPNAQRLRYPLRRFLGETVPPIGDVIFGVDCSFLGVVSTAALTLGGLFLAYRNILRRRSVLIYFAAYVLGLICFSFFTAGGFTKVPKIDLLLLTAYQFFASDVIFAAVIILALPGSEPLTAGGRRVYLLLAGLLTPLLERAGWPIPAAVTMLAALQPLAPAFDYFFERRSWVNHAAPPTSAVNSPPSGASN